MIAPQPIESKLNGSPARQHTPSSSAIATNSLGALIAPKFLALEELARQQGIASSTRRRPARQPAVMPSTSPWSTA